MSTSALYYPWLKSALLIGIGCVLNFELKTKGVEISAWTFLRLDFVSKFIRNPTKLPKLK